MKEALAIEPGNATVACNLAAALMTQGDVDAALDLLSAVQVNLIQSKHLLFSVHFNLACANSLKGETDAAVSNLLQAATFDPYATLASIGDVQLDAIRNDSRVQDLVPRLEESSPPDLAEDTP
jgi:hypothetical protein